MNTPQESSSKKTMPDVAVESTKTFASLQWVGMDQIELPVQVLVGSQWVTVPAKIRAQVSLDRQASRGIHMSRLFVAVQELAGKAITLASLKEVVGQFLMTHKDLSSAAVVEVRFEAPVQRKALKSSHQAWRTYPVVMSVVGEGDIFRSYQEVLVTYSSTCPASAALSRQLIQEAFQTKFPALPTSSEELLNWLGSTQGIVATPHSQRSEARVKVQVSDDFSFVTLIDLVEEALQTPVQTAVKREDEQEFALRNGQNLMFCEDAARRVAAVLNPISGVQDYVARFDHFESLHPHNATSMVSKGLKLKGFEI